MNRSYLARLQDGAATPPPAVGDTRHELAAELLRGSGIEIGALHLPMVLPARVSVRYVDRMTVPELRVHYPELDGQELAPVDVVDDGELLSTIEPESVDFIVANHFLEHCEDPIRTIETHLGKLRPGGVLFYAVPDKRYTFDFRRPRTPLSHVIADHKDGGQASRREHYLEWVRLVYPEGDGPPDEEAARVHAAGIEATRYSIHFHVWTQSDLLGLVLYCQGAARIIRHRGRPAIRAGEHRRVAQARRAGRRTEPSRRGYGSGGLASSDRRRRPRGTSSCG